LRGSCTVLGARGGEIPPRDSTIAEMTANLPNVRFSGMIEVKQDEDGYWYVYRNSDHYLMRDGEVATFATLEEAQRAADLHVRDPRTDHPSSDGLSWYIQPKFQIYRKCVIADNAVANSG